MTIATKDVAKDHPTHDLKDHPTHDLKDPKGKALPERKDPEQEAREREQDARERKGARAATGGLLLTIHNQHAEPPLPPDPAYTNAEPGRAFSYFENIDGEQWVYVYDLATRRGVVRSGKSGWDRDHAVAQGSVSTAPLNEAEQLWVRACWLATMGR
jgi:hypothetical protein